MVQASAKPITLEEFLRLPETTPASEYVDGAILQKPMPQCEHSTRFLVGYLSSDTRAKASTEDNEIRDKLL